MLRLWHLSGEQIGELHVEDLDHQSHGHLVAVKRFCDLAAKGQLGAAKRSNWGFSPKTQLGDGFKYFFSPRSLGKIEILTNIFQRGWFNHQLALQVR